jgi:S1-C subfamily serine protease
MKKIIFLLVVLFVSQLNYSQSYNIKKLNGFKYVNVLDMEYSNGKTDIYGLSGRTRNFLNNLGIPSPPNNAFNPCEVMSVVVNESPGSGSLVLFQVYDCNRNIVFETSGRGTNWVNDFNDNFQRALNNIFKQLKKIKYSYNPSLAVKYDIEMPNYSGDEFDIENEKTIREYFDNRRSDSIEGIWNYVSSDNNEYKMVIIKDDYNYNGYIIESNTWWIPGEEKVVFEPAAVNSAFTVNWTMGDKITKNKSFATLDGGLIKFNIQDTETILYKVYPQIDGKRVSDRKTSNEWSGNGSGVIISRSGYIVTNHHVIEDANEIEVEFVMNNELKKFSAQIVQSDKVNDLAVIKIFDMNFDGLNELPYNFKTRTSEVGTKVYAYGYPMALSLMGKEIKITDGIISSKSGIDGDITTYQISAAIQPGNSGGPLFDDKGNLIGINSSGLARLGSETTGYTIKSNYVLNLIDVLPNSITLPSNTKLESLPLTEQIKEISKFVVLVKVK